MMNEHTHHTSGMAGEVWKAEFAEWMKSEDLRVEAAEVITTSAGIFRERVFFIGVNFLYCRRGAFRFAFDDHSDIILKAGEMLIVYARRFVTIEALDTTKDNVLAFCVVAGDFAPEYASRLGFWNYLHTPCSYPDGSLIHLQAILAHKNTSEGDAKTEALCLFNSMMRSIWEEIRMNGDTAFYDAVRTINQKVLEGKARVKDLLTELHISRTHLHRLFVRNGFESVGAFIKDTQFHYALKLLRVSNFKVSEISRKLGFASQSNFTTFIRQHTGKSPLQLRGKGPIPRS